MRTVVSGQLHQLDSPAFAIGQVLFFQAWEKWFNLFKGIFMGDIFDFGRKGRWIAEYIVFKINSLHNFVTKSYRFIKLSIFNNFFKR